MFIRFESFRSFLRFYPIVSIIIAINIIVFLFCRIVPHFGPMLFQTLIGRNLWISQGEYWRLITPIFLHLSVGHVLFNSFATILFAPALERILGKIKFIFLYLAAGVIANIAGFFLASPMFTHAGASGAIFSLFGVYIYMVLFRKDLIDRNSSKMIILILIFSLIMTFLTPNIDVIGHLFGLISGLALAPPLLARVPAHYAWRPVYVQPKTSYHEYDEPTFNPNRWRGKKFRGNTGKKIFWGILGIFIIAGLLSMIMGSLF